MTHPDDAFAALLRYLKTTKIDTWAKRCEADTMINDIMKIATAEQKVQLHEMFGIFPFGQPEAFAVLLRYLKTTKIDTWAIKCEVDTMINDVMKTATVEQKVQLHEMFGIGEP